MDTAKKTSELLKRDGSPGFYRRRRMEPYWLIAPGMLVLLLVSAYPVLYGVFISLTDLNLLSGAKATPHLVGLANYARLLTNPAVLGSIGSTFVFAASTVLCTLLFGFAVALLLNSSLPGINIFRTLNLLPIIITPVVVGITWRFLYNTDFGVIPYYLRLLGLPDIHWLEDPKWALIAVIIVDVWQWTPFATLILLAALQSLPDEPYEAASIDGASAMGKFRYLTLPAMGPSFLIVLLMRTTDAFKAFDTIFVLTEGGPGRATEVLNLYAYRFGFRWGDMGQGAAVAVLVGLIILVLSVVYLRVLPRQQGS